RNSIFEAELDEAQVEEIAYDVESAAWEAVPASAAAIGRCEVAFVDGVQSLDIGVVEDEIGQRPVGGIMASYAAGAMCIGQDPPLRHVVVERAIIMGDGREPPGVTIRVGGYEAAYRPM